MINKAKQIREFKQANPSAPINKIADACNATVAYVYQVLHKVKAKQIKPVATPTAGQDVLRKEITRLNEHIADLKYERTQMDHLMAEYREECRKLKLHHGGLEYIISYLESRLGIKEQDGTTV
jgi:rubrerythrin